MVQEIFNLLTVINTVAIGVLFYILLFKRKIEVSESDIIRIISLIGTILEILKNVIQNPNKNIQKRLKFAEELIKVIEDEFKKKYKKEVE